MEPPEGCCKREGRNLCLHPQCQEELGEGGEGRAAGSITREGSKCLISSVLLWVLPLWKGIPCLDVVLFVSLHQPGERRRGTPGQGVPSDALGVHKGASWLCWRQRVCGVMCLDPVPVW